MARPPTLDYLRLPQSNAIGTPSHSVSEVPKFRPYRQSKLDDCRPPGTAIAGRVVPPHLVAEAPKSTGMADPVRRCRVSGCGPLSKSSQSREAWLSQVCDFHQAAETVELDGEMWRFCRPCLVFHSLNWFLEGQHVCQRYTGR